ncbi:MAG: response regulator [Pirellulaceae bacterium]
MKVDETPDSTSAKPGSKVSLLIVDDETDFRESACRYLGRIGFDVDEAEDGEEALNVTTNKKFDVVILDIHMPGINGIETLKQLMQRDPAPKVVMLTGGGTIENAVESIKLGAYDFLTKPIKMDDLARWSIGPVRLSNLRKRIGNSRRLFGVRHQNRI